MGAVQGLSQGYAVGKEKNLEPFKSRIDQNIPEEVDLLLVLIGPQPFGHTSPGEAPEPRRLLSPTFVILFQVLLSTWR